MLTLVSARIDEEWFGLSFNEKCNDGYAYAGTDLTRLGRTMKGYGIIWPHDVDRDNPPIDGQIFDLLEFSYEFIAEAKDPHYHSYMSHSHYSYDREAGRAKFTQDVNRMFERNGMAFELKDGEVVRLAPSGSSGSPCRQARFGTGDPTLDEMLEAARPQDPEQVDRRSARVSRKTLGCLGKAEDARTRTRQERKRRSPLGQGGGRADPPRAA